VRVLQATRGATLTGSSGSSTASTPARPDGGSGSSQSATPRLRVVLAVAIAVLALDIASKQIVVATLSDRRIRLLGGLLTLLESRNPGAAFSLGGSSETIVFTAIAVGVVIFIVRAARRIYSPAWAVALGLLLGGATGNLADRIFRSPGIFRGWVVDWIELPHWPVFNLADSAITCGGVLMVLLAIFGHGIEGRAGAAGDHAVPPAEPQHPRQENPTGRG
jgi:lipoprotein signal peptidase